MKTEKTDVEQQRMNHAGFSTEDHLKPSFLKITENKAIDNMMKC